MEINWIIKPEGDSKIVENLSQSINVSNRIANLLVQRNITNYDQAKAFFRPSLDNLYNPFLMQDMHKAVDRLNMAVNNNERILVYGDYDVDGTTSVALIYSFLQKRHSNIDYYIPDRYAEGYGISYKGIDYADDNDCSLIIALDCGIKANKKIDYANNKNIDFIICDHHTPGNQIPKAVAVLDPKRADCNYPYKELSGCGVGFKLLQAFCINNKLPIKELWYYLDLVAVSIGSDIVEITGENRILAYFGLKILNSKPCVGLQALKINSGFEDKEMTISDVVFKIGPQINAAGRIKSGRDAVKLLIEKDPEYAQDLGFAIKSYNEERKNIEKTITDEAFAMLAADSLCEQKKSTVLFNKNWHKGVIGIVASRVIEHYYKPTIILTESNGMATGSARSVSGFDLYSAIDKCSNLLESFGGHKHAAGLTLKIEKLEAFTQKFEKEVSAVITADQLIPKIQIDEILDFANIKNSFFNVLRQFAPFGPGNMSPIFMSEDIQNTGYSRIVGKTEEHVKFDIMDKDNYKFSGIGFSMADKFSIIEKEKFNICYSVEENEFMGETRLQLRIRDVKQTINFTS